MAARTTQQLWKVIVATALLCASAMAATKPAIIAAPGPSPALAPVLPPALAPVLPPALPPKPLTLHDKVVAALRASSHYGALSGLLDSLAEGSIIKEGTTLFAPDDSAFSGLNMNSTSLLMTTLNYHVATSVYTYDQLTNLPLNATLQTASPDVVIFVTGTGKSGLRLDDSAIADPDIYADGQVSVQGISTIMDTAKYNKLAVPPAAAPTPSPVDAASPAAAPGVITQPAPKAASPSKSDASARHVATSTLLLALALHFFL